MSVEIVATEIHEQLQDKQSIFFEALGIGLVAIAIAWYFGLFKPFKISKLPAIKGGDVIKAFFRSFFLSFIFAPLLFLVFSLFFVKNSSFDVFLKSHVGWAYLLTTLGGWIGVIWTYFTLSSIQRDQIWQQTTAPWYINIAIGIVVWFVSFPVALVVSEGMALITWSIFHHTFVEQTAVQRIREMMNNHSLFWLNALVMVTIVPFTEEFLFRGLLQSWLKQKFSHPAFALLLTSLLFAFAHYSSQQGFSNIELLSCIFVLSCMLGYLYERQRSLWAPIGLHSFFNFMNVLMLYIQG